MRPDVIGSANMTRMQGRWRHLGALAVVIVAAALVLSGCPKTNPQADPTTTTASTAPKVDKDADRDTAKASALALDDLPGNGWKKSTTATTAKKKSTNSGSSFDCPELGEDITNIEKSAALFEAPTYERQRPYTEVRNTVSIVATPEDAIKDVEANKRPEARDCLQKGLAHDIAKEGSNFDVKVSDWKLPKVGDSRVGYEISLTTDNNGTPFEAFIGIAFVRVGRTLTTISITVTEPLSDDADEIVKASVQKIKDNQ